MKLASVIFLNRLPAGIAFFVLLSSAVFSALTAKGQSLAYTNTGSIPAPGTYTIPNIDATNFYNYGSWNIISEPTPYQMSDVFNYYNNALMSSTVGWIFNFQPHSGSSGWSSTFTNDNNGNISAGSAQLTLATPPVGYLLVLATNIVNKGMLSADASCLIQLTGSNVNLSRSKVQIMPVSTAASGNNNSAASFTPSASIYDEYWGAGTNTYVNSAGIFNTGGFGTMATVSAQSPPYYVNEPCGVANAGPLGMYLSGANIVDSTNINANLYALTVTNINGAVASIMVPSNTIRQAVFVYAPLFTGGVTFSPSTVFTNPFETMAVQLASPYTNAATLAVSTNFVYIVSTLASETNSGFYANPVLDLNSTCYSTYGTFRPASFNISRSDPGAYGNGLPGAGTPTNNFFYDGVTNPIVGMGYVAYSASINNVAADTTYGPSVTNLPGRMKITANNLNLNLARIRAEGEVVINASNLTSSAGAVVDCQNLSYNLGSFSGFLNVTNLAQTSVSRLNGTVSAWSATWQNSKQIVTPSYLVTTNTTYTTNSFFSTTNNLAFTTNFIYVNNMVVTTNDSIVSTNDMVFITNNMFVSTNLAIYETVTNSTTYYYTNMVFTTNRMGFSTNSLVFTTNADGLVIATNIMVVNPNNISISATNVTPAWITNTVQLGYSVLLVDASQLNTAVPVSVQNLILTSTNMVVSDSMAVVNSAAFNGTSLTIIGNLSLAGLIGDWNYIIDPSLRYFTNSGSLELQNNAHFGDDTATNYLAFVNDGTINAGNQTINTALLQINNGVNYSQPGGFSAFFQTGQLFNASIYSASDIQFTGGSLAISQSTLSTSGALDLTVTNSLFDGGVAYGNMIQVGNGFNLYVKPLTGSLFGSTIQSAIASDFAVDHIWNGIDYGATFAGFTNNAAVGDLALIAQNTSTGDPLFHFYGTGSTSNAMYVGLLDLSGIGASSLAELQTELQVDPGMTIYYANVKVGFALPNGTNAAAYLNGQFGQNGGNIRWVKGYATQVTSPITINGLSGGGSSGAFNLTFTGIPGQSYIIQASTNLMNWTSISTNTGPIITFTNPNTNGIPYQFYRSLIVQ